MAEKAGKLEGLGLLVVLSGPSGVGKNTVAECLVEAEGWERLVTATTRSPRPIEKDGIDYHFLSPDEFRKKMDGGFFLEHTETFGDMYGSPLEPVRDAVEKGRAIFLVIDVKGGMRLKKMKIDACYIFVAPPDRNALMNRLKRRATEDEKTMNARIERAEAELAVAQKYDHIVVNHEDDLDTTVKEIEKIVAQALAERRKRN
ncbi:MAG: guanylate kinase [Planctomycetota bacterium]